MTRTNTKIGDVFSVKINDTHKKYFQLIAFDSTQLNSDVIRAFKKIYPLNEEPELSEIIKGEVEFYAHCVTKFGLKLNFWQNAGNINEIGDHSNVMFRGTSDYGVRRGQEPIKVSKNWYVWKIDDKDFTTVGELKGENRNAYIGLIINPVGILEMLRGNKYPINYPDFE